MNAERDGLTQAIEQRMLELAAARSGATGNFDKTICPSEVARSFADPGSQDWRGLMPKIRAAAVHLALERRLVITRKGKPADPQSFRGVYRLRLPKPDEMLSGDEQAGADQHGLSDEDRNEDRPLEGE